MYVYVCMVRCPHVIDFDWPSQTGRWCNYYTYGVAVVQVEIDCLTGNYTVFIVSARRYYHHACVCLFV